MRTLSLRLVAATLAAALLSAPTSVSAHATLVIGTLSVAPDPVGDARQLTITLRLEDPGLVEVEDAVVFVELRLRDGGTRGQDADAEPNTPADLASDRLTEVAPGRYAVTVPTPAPGTYLVSVRDRTYRQEEAVANLVIELDPTTALGEHAFVLPPTATGPTALGTWLLWLIGVPLLAGALVTYLVMRGGGPDGEAGSAGAGSGTQR